MKLAALYLGIIGAGFLVFSFIEWVNPLWLQ